MVSSFQKSLYNLVDIKNAIVVEKRFGDPEHYVASAQLFGLVIEIHANLCIIGPNVFNVVVLGSCL